MQAKSSSSASSSRSPNWGALNEALGYSMLTYRLAKSLGLAPVTEGANHGGIPEESKQLSELLNRQVFLQSGLGSFNGSIKGNAVLGFLVQYTLEKFTELCDGSDIDKQLALLAFIKSHPDYKEINSEFFQKDGNVKPEFLQTVFSHIALYETFKNKPIIVRSSGSFAFAMLDTAQKLVKAGIFNKGELHVQVRVPNPHWTGPEGEKLTTEPKHNAIEKKRYETEQAGVKCEIVQWAPGADRQKTPDFNPDYEAFIEACQKNGFFFPTNAHSKEQILDIYGKKARDDHGRTFFQKYKQPLDKMGLSLTQDELTASKDLDGSMYGLMLAALYQVEDLLGKGVKNYTVIDPSSAGSTVGSLARVFTLLARPKNISPENLVAIEELFPNLAKAVRESKTNDAPVISPKLLFAFDRAYPNLYLTMKQNGIEAPEWQYNEYGTDGGVSGQVASSRSGAAEKALLDAHSVGIFEGGIDCPHNFMEIARVILLAASAKMHGKDARYPESAGAAALGAELHRMYIKKEITPERIALWLRENNVNYDTFVQIASQENKTIKGRSSSEDSGASHTSGSEDGKSSTAASIVKEVPGHEYLTWVSELHATEMRDFTGSFFEAMKNPDSEQLQKSVAEQEKAKSQQKSSATASSSKESPLCLMITGFVNRIPKSILKSMKVPTTSRSTTPDIQSESQAATLEASKQPSPALQGVESTPLATKNKEVQERNTGQ